MTTFIQISKTVKLMHGVGSQERVGDLEGAREASDMQLCSASWSWRWLQVYARWEKSTELNSYDGTLYSIFLYLCSTEFR